MDSCRFADNIDTKVGDSQELAQFGALYLYFVSVLFVNKVEFHSNLGSGIVAVSAELRYAEATDSLFLNNTAIHGAGISTSWQCGDDTKSQYLIHVSRQCSLSFWWSHI